MSKLNFLTCVLSSANRSRGEIEDSIDARRGECATTKVLELQAAAYDGMIEDLKKDIADENK